MFSYILIQYVKFSEYPIVHMQYSSIQLNNNYNPLIIQTLVKAQV